MIGRQASAGDRQNPAIIGLWSALRRDDGVGPLVPDVVSASMDEVMRRLRDGAAARAKAKPEK